MRLRSHYQTTLAYCRVPGASGLLVILGGLLLAFGCVPGATRQAARMAAVPDISLGPVVELLTLKPSAAEVRVVIDASARAHVIVASSTTRAVLHLVMDEDHVLETNNIAILQDERGIDAAIDRRGTLHVLIGDRYFIHEEGSRWVPSKETPWNDTGLKVTHPRFVRGTENLVWAFRISGPESGATRRWDFTGTLIGGPVAAIPLFWVWPTYGSKLAVVQHTKGGRGVWNILDRSDKSDSVNCKFAGSFDGMVYVAYDAARGGLLAEGSPRYVQFALCDSAPETPVDPPPGIPFRAIQGTPVKGLRQQGTSHGFGSETALSADPVTGTVLILRAHDRSWLVRQGRWNGPVSLPFSASGPWEPRLCPAGSDRFHALLLGGSHVFYLVFSEHGWSAPVDLGEAHTSSFFGWFGATVQIGSDLQGRALAVWPVKQGLNGRWIYLKGTSLGVGPR